MKAKIFSIILFFLSVVIFVALAEALLWLTGHTPWTYTRLDANEPIMHEPDPVLGWTNKKGKHVVPAYDPSGQDIHMTFIAHGQRLTKAKPTASKNEFVIVGGS